VRRSFTISIAAFGYDAPIATSFVPTFQSPSTPSR
jgi:hypothetical protein